MRPCPAPRGYLRYPKSHWNTQGTLAFANRLQASQTRPSDLREGGLLAGEHAQGVLRALELLVVHVRELPDGPRHEDLWVARTKNSSLEFIACSSKITYFKNIFIKNHLFL